MSVRKTGNISVSESDFFFGAGGSHGGINGKKGDDAINMLKRELASGYV